jgi:hypothetical protein
MPSPGTYDLAPYRGDDYGWRFVLWQDTAKTQPVDLTGCTAKAEIRDKSNGTKIAALTSVVTMPNTITVTLTAAVSRTAPNGKWDLQVTFPTGVRTVVAGSVKFTEDITDSTPV